ncbi:MAG: helix-turn-helix domain-containing protein [Thermoflexibacteraceae bacterium]|jgi:transcriptional regulator with XRE-family HTH domain
MMSIGEKIAIFRKRKGLSQEQMAEALEMSPQGYGKIERDETDVSYSRLEIIAKTFGISLEHLVGYGDKQKSYNSNGNTNTIFLGDNSTAYNYTDKDLNHALEKVEQEVVFLKEKNKLLEDKIQSLELLVDLLQQGKQV